MSYSKVVGDLVCSVSDEQDKYCMSIIYKDCNNPDYVEGENTYSSMNINAGVVPTFSYYDRHCMGRISMYD